MANYRSTGFLLDMAVRARHAVHVLAISACLFCSGHVAWADPGDGSFHSLQVNTTPIPAPSPESTGISGISFRTPVYGASRSASAEWDESPDNRVDSFTKVFPVWCFWPIVGLILILAGMDLRARARRQR